MDEIQLKADEEVWLERLIHESEDSAFAIVILGSVARGTRTDVWSDFDVLVVEASFPEAPPSVHVMAFRRQELRSRLASGDDLAHWAVRYGRPILGSYRWNRFADSCLRNASWPTPRIKLRQARDRHRVATALLEVGDATSAQKEAIYAASHVSRALLLANGVFPLSRPELSGQLRDLGQETAAVVLDEITKKAPPDRLDQDLQWIVDTIQTLESSLDAHRPQN